MNNAFKLKHVLFIIPLFIISAIIIISNNQIGLVQAQSTNDTFLTYQNLTYGITIKYPSNWTLDDSGGVDDTDVDIITFNSPSQSDNATVDVHQDKLDTDISNIDSYLKFTISSYQQDLKNFNIIESDKNSSISGNNAYKLIYTYTNDNGTKMKDLETGTIGGNNNVYYIVYDGEASVFDKYLPSVQRMINSLQIH